MLSADAEYTADHALGRLAQHYRAAPSGTAWRTATANLRRHIADDLRCVLEGAPPWLLSLAPPLLLRECLFTKGRRDEEGLKEFLSSSPA
ncbi:hypothetical protein AB0O76_34155 [Streptomyces sp. NPDC086554]|uniref:hypothetical protein n=1 Tax=Streptomyces sp. NPDC086554 TaxID=3154864 RepID=UPI0034430E04